MRRVAAVLLACALPAAGAQWSELNRAASEALRARDYAQLRKVLVQLKPLMPGSPRVIYNLAASDAMLGNRDAALAGLDELARMGLIYDLDGDTDFVSLRASVAYRNVIARMRQNGKPVTHAALAFPVPGQDVLPEDIANDPKTHRFLISSVRRSQIITAEGQEFARAPWSVFALATDAKRRTLWATTAWVPHCDACMPSDKDKTALLAFDLDTGALRRRIESPVPGLLGDMTISRAGDVYVSEGIHGAIFQLAPGATALLRLDAPGEFPSPQTPALSADEKTLFVPDYVRGIAAIDCKTHAVRWLAPAPGIALTGIDGLYVHGGFFIAVQNGTNPPRVMRFPLDLASQEVLEANTTGLGEPTHGTFVGDVFYFLTNSGWSNYGADGKKKAGLPPTVSAVWKLPVRAH